MPAWAEACALRRPDEHRPEGAAAGARHRARQHAAAHSGYWQQAMMAGEGRAYRTPQHEYLRFVDVWTQAETLTS